MKIDLTSFRFRIVLTLLIVVSVFSSLAIYINNNFLINKIYDNSEKNIENILYLLKGEIINIHDGRLIKPLLQNISKDKRIIQVYMMDKNGNLVFPAADSVNKADTAEFRKLMGSGQEIQVVTSRSRRQPSSLAFLRLNNSMECYGCHAKEINPLGYIAMNVSLNDTKNTLAYTRNFSILFTISIVIIIMVFVLVMHYRFIKKSLALLQNAIIAINNGDLNERVGIKETSELAKLGISFNKMLDNFQRTQLELSQYHQKELESAEKLATIGEMAARLAHDVRNPLTGIANSIEIIVADLKDSPNRLVLEEIKRQTSRVNVAISNLLKYSRSVEIKKNRGNINALLDNLVFFLRSQKQNSKVVFNLDTDPHIPEIDYDPEQMENVLMNLCINAIQAMQNDGMIGIKTSSDNARNTILISVEDNGPGIPGDIKDEIFKPFFTTRTEGTGLGLAIVKDIIEKHRGKIWFESKHKNGTVFYISLPVNPIEGSNGNYSIKPT